MKQKPSFEPHLVLKTMSLMPGAEWVVRSPGWMLLHVTSGVGYWLHPKVNYELSTGSVLVCSELAPGVIRGSQVGESLIHYFCVQPARLAGFITLAEQLLLQRSAAQDKMMVRRFTPNSPVSEKFRQLCQRASGHNLVVRLQLVELFVQVFGDELIEPSTGSAAVLDAKQRLVNLLQQIPASELLEMTFADLVRTVRCTPRHLTRIFHQVVGLSFRQKQAQVRLMRAKELLATTESKVVEVALESGYQSLSLFNFMFKRQFGVTPAKWRDQTRSARSLGIGGRRVPFLRV